MAPSHPGHTIASTTRSADTSKPFSISLATSKVKVKPQSNLNSANPKKRLHSTLADSDSDREETYNGPQFVASFDHAAGGAIGVDGPQKAKAPLVIQSRTNKNWREEIRRRKGKNLLPAEVQALRSGQDLTHSITTEHDVRPREFGLSVVQKTAENKENDVKIVDVPVSSLSSNGESIAPKSADEEAIEALTGNSAKKSTLVLPRRSLSPDTSQFLSTQSPMNEDELFRWDVASRPDSAKLQDYVAVPVDEFGAALLRGLGWKDGDGIGKHKGLVSKPRVVEQRPALLGIGAKEVPDGVGEELGAWGKVPRGKRKTEKAYNPVLLKNSKTGELLTEEELEAKKESRRKEEEEDWRERRDRNLTIDEARKSERAHLESGRRHRDVRYDSKDARSRSVERKRHSSAASSSSFRRDRSRSVERSRHGSSRKGSSRRERSRSSGRESRDSHRYRDDHAEHYDRRERGHRSRDSRKDERSFGAHKERTRYDHRDEHDDAERRRRQEVF